MNVPCLFSGRWNVGISILRGTALSQDLQGIFQFVELIAKLNDNIHRIRRRAFGIVASADALVDGGHARRGAFLHRLSRAQQLGSALEELHGLDAETGRHRALVRPDSILRFRERSATGSGQVLRCVP